MFVQTHFQRTRHHTITTATASTTAHHQHSFLRSSTVPNNSSSSSSLTALAAAAASRTSEKSAKLTSKLTVGSASETTTTSTTSRRQQQQNRGRAARRRGDAGDSGCSAAAQPAPRSTSTPAASSASNHYSAAFTNGSSRSIERTELCSDASGNTSRALVAAKHKPAGGSLNRLGNSLTADLSPIESIASPWCSDCSSSNNNNNNSHSRNNLTASARPVRQVACSITPLAPPLPPTATTGSTNDSRPTTEQERRQSASYKSTRDQNIDHPQATEKRSRWRSSWSSDGGGGSGDGGCCCCCCCRVQVQEYKRIGGGCGEPTRPAPAYASAQHCATNKIQFCCAGPCDLRFENSDAPKIRPPSPPLRVQKQANISLPNHESSCDVEDNTETSPNCSPTKVDQVAAAGRQRQRRPIAAAAAAEGRNSAIKGANNSNSDRDRCCAAPGRRLGRNLLNYLRAIVAGDRGRRDHREQILIILILKRNLEIVSSFWVSFIAYQLETWRQLAECTNAQQAHCTIAATTTNSTTPPPPSGWRAGSREPCAVSHSHQQALCKPPQTASTEPQTNATSCRYRSATTQLLTISTQKGEQRATNSRASAFRKTTTRAQTTGQQDDDDGGALRAGAMPAPAWLQSSGATSSPASTSYAMMNSASRIQFSPQQHKHSVAAAAAAAAGRPMLNSSASCFTQAVTQTTSGQGHHGCHHQTVTATLSLPEQPPYNHHHQHQHYRSHHYDGPSQRPMTTHGFAGFDKCGDAYMANEEAEEEEVEDEDGNGGVEDEGCARHAMLRSAAVAAEAADSERRRAKVWRTRSGFSATFDHERTIESLPPATNFYHYHYQHQQPPHSGHLERARDRPASGCESGLPANCGAEGSLSEQHHSSGGTNYRAEMGWLPERMAMLSLRSPTSSDSLPACVPACNSLYPTASNNTHSFDRSSLDEPHSLPLSRPSTAARTPSSVPARRPSFGGRQAHFCDLQQQAASPRSQMRQQQREGHNATTSNAIAAAAAARQMTGTTDTPATQPASGQRRHEFSLRHDDDNAVEASFGHFHHHHRHHHDHRHDSAALVQSQQHQQRPTQQSTTSWSWSSDRQPTLVSSDSEINNKARHLAAGRQQLPMAQKLYYVHTKTTVDCASKQKCSSGGGGVEEPATSGGSGRSSAVSPAAGASNLQAASGKKSASPSGKLGSQSKLSLAGAKRRLGFKQKGLSSISVQRSEEVVPLEAQPKLMRQTTFNSLTDSGNESGSCWLGPPDPRSCFVEGLGAGQIASRQALVAPYLGDLQLSLSDRRGMLEVEVVRARRLSMKADAKTLPSPYVKVYLMKNKKCIAKCKTAPVRRTLNPLYQQQFIFRVDYADCVLQVIVWGDYGKKDRKSLMGVVQIHLDDLDISNLVIGWYKLFNAPSMASSVLSSKALRHTLLPKKGSGEPTRVPAEHSI